MDEYDYLVILFHCLDYFFLTHVDLGLPFGIPGTELGDADLAVVQGDRPE